MPRNGVPVCKPAGMTLHMERSKRKDIKAWNWEIRDRKGVLISRGARAGTKAEVWAHCKKFMDRQDKGMGPSWRGYQPETEQC